MQVVIYVDICPTGSRLQRENTAAMTVCVLISINTVHTRKYKLSLKSLRLLKPTDSRSRCDWLPPSTKTEVASHTTLQSRGCLISVETDSLVFLPLLGFPASPRIPDKRNQDVREARMQLKDLGCIHWLAIIACKAEVSKISWKSLPCLLGFARTASKTVGGASYLIWLGSNYRGLAQFCQTLSVIIFLNLSLRLAPVWTIFIWCF